MGRSPFTVFLLLSSLLFLSLRPGLARNVLENGGDGLPLGMELQGTRRKAREMLGVEVMDYEPTGPNVNSRSGYPFIDPSPVPEDPAPSPSSHSD